jgi:hypothetical protein
VPGGVAGNAGNASDAHGATPAWSAPNAGIANSAEIVALGRSSGSGTAARPDESRETPASTMAGSPVCRRGNVRRR